MDFVKNHFVGGGTFWGSLWDHILIKYLTYQSIPSHTNNLPADQAKGPTNPGGLSVGEGLLPFAHIGINPFLGDANNSSFDGTLRVSALLPHVSGMTLVQADLRNDRTQKIANLQNEDQHQTDPAWKSPRKILHLWLTVALNSGSLC